MDASHPVLDALTSTSTECGVHRLILGSNSLAEKYAESAERMVDLQVELVSMITATFPLEDYAQALAAARSPDHIKVQVA